MAKEFKWPPLVGEPNKAKIVVNTTGCFNILCSKRVNNKCSVWNNGSKDCRDFMSFREFLFTTNDKSEEINITPGPWRIEFPEQDKNYIRIRGSRLGKRFKIANVLQIYSNFESVERENKANVKAISLVPEMLDILERLCNGKSVKKSEAIKILEDIKNA